MAAGVTGRCTDKEKELVRNVGDALGIDLPGCAAVSVVDTGDGMISAVEFDMSTRTSTFVNVDATEVKTTVTDLNNNTPKITSAPGTVSQQQIDAAKKIILDSQK